MGPCSLGLTKERLESGQGLDWRYIAFHDPQDDEAHLTCECHCKYLEGVMMQVSALHDDVIMMFEPRSARDSIPIVLRRFKTECQPELSHVSY
jgi:hypothetical protein